jgi:hypothetical protein
VIVRLYKPPDRDGVLALVERLQEGVAPWRDAAAVRAAMDKWVREAMDLDASGTRAVFVAEKTARSLASRQHQRDATSRATSTHTSGNSPSPGTSSVAASAGS